MSVEPDTDDVPLTQRIQRNPRPALLWLLGLAILLAVELGALAGVVMSVPWEIPTNAIAGVLPGEIESAFLGVASFLAGIGRAFSDLPTLLTRDLIPNHGYYVPPSSPLLVQGWQSTFFGLSPIYSWLLRVGLIYAYALTFVWWIVRGYLTFRRHYRYADWTPTDDIIDRLRRHRWGQFGMLLVFSFVVLAVFAPSVSPATMQQNIMNPYGHFIEYYNNDAQSVQKVSVGTANLASKSIGARSNVGLWQYDKYGRFHPIGTLTTGKDMMTYMAYGARVSLFVGLFAATVAGGIALILALLTAYYKGLADLSTVLVSDSMQAMPLLLVLILVSVVFADTWINNIFDGAFLIALIIGFWGWPGLWRAVRGPSFQVVENEWVDAAESFGERPTVLVRKHVMPYVIGYLLIYLSMSIGGYIIASASLSFIGLGILPPTPEWGRLVAAGQQFITTRSWHISVIPGIAITLLVLGFNAFGDGIRDAIDPQSEGGRAAGEAAAGGGGG